MGSLTIITGPMFSAKTTTLMRQIEITNLLEKPSLLFNYYLDNRYGDNVIGSHNKFTISCNSIKEIDDIFNHEDYSKAQYIFIDEFQFFKNAKDKILKMVNEDKKLVFLAGLMTNFKNEYFGDLYLLVPYAERINKLSALCLLCKDGTQACFTCSDNKNTETVCISNCKFFSVCRKHYIELTK